MIYRIHPNIKSFLMLAFDGDNAREALGEDTDFYMDERPFSYKDEWKVMIIGFSDAFGGNSKKVIPDISVNVGKLFLSVKAYKYLKNLIGPCGELLPVQYDGQDGYIFNGLMTRKANEKLSIHDPLNDLFSIVFENDNDSSYPVFKAEIDFNAYFCHAEFKQIVEENNLTGITFSQDLGNPFPEALGMKTEH